MLQFERVTKIYTMGTNKVIALDNVTFTMETGEFVAIMGSSGSGKSTLMNLAGCLDRPTSGSYSLDGVAVHNLDDKRLAEVRRTKLGFVFQSFNLLAHATALENVELPMVYAGVSRKVRRQRALDTLAMVGLAKRSDHRPSQLSGGQAQRVAIARALVNSPQLVLADEPTGALDTRTSEEVMSLFADLHRQGIGILLVTHEPDVALHAERAVLFRDGKIISEGTPHQIQATK